MSENVIEIWCICIDLLVEHPSTQHFDVQVLGFQSEFLSLYLTTFKTQKISGKRSELPNFLKNWETWQYWPHLGGRVPLNRAMLQCAGFTGQPQLEGWMQLLCFAMRVELTNSGEGFEVFNSGKQWFDLAVGEP